MAKEKSDNYGNISAASTKTSDSEAKKLEIIHYCEEISNELCSLSEHPLLKKDKIMLKEINDRIKEFLIEFKKNDASPLTFFEFLISHISAINYRIEYDYRQEMNAPSLIEKIQEKINKGQIIAMKYKVHSQKLPTQEELKKEQNLVSDQDALDASDTFRILLNDIKEYAIIRKLPSKIIFISYAWPIGNMHDEAWSQKFIATLTKHLKEAGFQAYLDIIQSSFGKPLNIYMDSKINAAEHVLVIGSRTMKYKYNTDGYTGACYEYFQVISRWRAERKERLIIPVCLNEANNHVGFMTTFSAWSPYAKGYKRSLLDLITIIYGFNVEFEKEFELWRNNISRSLAFSDVSRKISNTEILPIKLRLIADNELTTLLNKLEEEENYRKWCSWQNHRGALFAKETLEKLLGPNQIDSLKNWDLYFWLKSFVDLFKLEEDFSSINGNDISIKSIIYEKSKSMSSNDPDKARKVTITNLSFSDFLISFTCLLMHIYVATKKNKPRGLLISNNKLLLIIYNEIKIVVNAYRILTTYTNDTLRYKIPYTSLVEELVLQFSSSQETTLIIIPYEYNNGARCLSITKIQQNGQASYLLSLDDSKDIQTIKNPQFQIYTENELKEYIADLFATNAINNPNSMRILNRLSKPINDEKFTSCPSLPRQLTPSVVVNSYLMGMFSRTSQPISSKGSVFEWLHNEIVAFNTANTNTYNIYTSENRLSISIKRTGEKAPNLPRQLDYFVKPLSSYTIPPATNSVIRGLALLADNYLAGRSDDGRIFIWNIHKKKLLKQFKAHNAFLSSYGVRQNVCSAIKVLMNGHMVSGGKDGIIYIWNIKALIEENSMPEPKMLFDASALFLSVNIFALEELSNNRVVVGTDNGKIIFLIIENETVLTHGIIEASKSSEIWEFKLLTSGLLAIGLKDGSIQIWNIEKKILIQTLKCEGEKGGVGQLLETPQGLFATYSNTYLMNTIDDYIGFDKFNNYHINTWVKNDSQNFGLPFVSSPSKLTPSSKRPIIALSTFNGEIIVSASNDGVLRIWRDGGNNFLQFNADWQNVSIYVTALCVFPNGRLAVTLSNNQIKIFKFPELGINLSKTEGPDQPNPPEIPRNKEASHRGGSSAFFLAPSITSRKNLSTASTKVYNTETSNDQIKPR